MRSALGPGGRKSAARRAGRARARRRCMVRGRSCARLSRSRGRDGAHLRPVAWRRRRACGECRSRARGRRSDAPARASCRSARANGIGSAAGAFIRARAPHRARSACASADFRQAAPAGRARWPFCPSTPAMLVGTAGSAAGRPPTKPGAVPDAWPEPIGASRRLGPGRARGAAAGLVLRCRRSSRIKRNSSCRRGN